MRSTNTNQANPELDVFGQLKPLYGEVIDKYYIAYVASRTPQQKAKILRRLQLLSIKVQQKRINDRKIFLEPPSRPELVGEGEYAIGAVVFPGKTPFPVTLSRKECLRHTLLIGPSGSGKTSWILNFMQELHADKTLLPNGIPWLSLDYKRSFRVLMNDGNGADVIILTVGSDIAPLRLNMLLPPPGVSTPAWVDNLTDTICTGYSLLDGAQSALKAVFLDVINQYGKHATLRDALGLLRQRFTEVPVFRRRQLGWMESTERALVQLTSGTVGDCLNERDHPMLVGELLERKVAIELEGLGQAQGTTLSIFFLQCTLLTRQKQRGPRETLRHVTIIDEAQNVFKREAGWAPLSLPSRTIREVREYGEAIIAATQQTDISDSLLGNSGTKILFRTNAKWDLEYFSKSFQVDPLYLTIIPNGQCITVLPGRWPKPFLMSFRENKLKNQEVTDEEVRERYLQWRAGFPLGSNQEESLDLSEKELALLTNISKNPLLTITQHYDRLAWNPKIGNNTKDALLRKKLIDLRIVEEGRTHRKFPYTTPGGILLMAAYGVAVKTVGPGSVEHEHWRDKIRKLCINHGYTVTTEHPLPDGRVDLHATRNDQRLLIEIETGKSDVNANIDKCQGHGTLILFFTNQDAHEKHRSYIPAHTIVITPSTIDTLELLLRD